MLDVRDQADLLTLRVDDVIQRADGVISLRLVDPGGARLPTWEPGAHVEVVLPSGLVRHYSLCGDPEQASHYVIAVLRADDGRGGSKELHRLAARGASLSVRKPRNRFALTHADHHLLVAGGIGVTPILAMARELARIGASWSAVYGGRSLGSMAFAEDLLALCPERVTLVPQDAMGLIDVPATLGASLPGTVVYCCGPEPLLQAVKLAGEGHETVRSVEFERFSAPLARAVEEPAAAFEVELRLSGRCVTVDPGSSILERVLAVVPEWPWSCREGYCGTCEAAVLEGSPEHHDDVLTDEEREDGATMMICVGRSRSPRLVLDI